MVIKALQKQHHLTRTAAGELLSREISCTACILAESGLCPTCEHLPKVPIKVIPRKITKKQLELENPVAEVEGAGEGDGGASDASDDDEAQVGSEAEDEEELAPGSLVWVRLLRHHPAVVLAPAEVPAKLSPLIAKVKTPSLFVRRLEEDDIKLVAVKRIKLLGMNKVDRERAEKTEGIQRGYNMAVAMLRGDV